MSYKDFFSGKRVTLIGLGLLGRGIGDARFLASQGAKLTVTDLKTAEQLASALDELKGLDITYHLGGHVLEDFENCDLVVKAAGVRLDSPYIAKAREAGIPIYMSTALFAKFAKEVGATIVGVTGTRGKSTVTQMIHHSIPGSILGGNIRGRSTLELLPTVKSGGIVVLELDSWQLQGFGDLALSPDVSVFTNLMPDHLNYYKNMDEYFADKANIFKYQTAPKIVAGKSIAEKIPNVRTPSPLPPDWKLKILGEHNIENAALAAEALRLLNISEEQIKAGVESFEAVEGRLQFVREVNGVKIFNDNNATTPDATLAALKAFDRLTMSIILIAGGADKGLDLSVFLEEIKKCKKVVWLDGSGTKKVNPSSDLIYQVMSQAVTDAFKAAIPGDILLFSPSFASFGLFKNEYDRNDQFLAAVKTL